MTILVKWPSIESFHNIRKATVKYPHLLNNTSEVTYRGKIKLHGCNSAIQLDEIVAQSRNNVLSIGNDNAGFAAWVNEYKTAIASSTRACKGMTVFGEWSGPGIQKGCAIHLLKERIFAIFALMNGEELISDPEEIKSYLKEFLMEVPNTYILPWYTKEIIIDWASREKLEPIVSQLNDAVAEVETCDPWVKSTFGLEGIGEGIVYYPISSAHAGRENFSALAFKAKGEMHKVVKSKEYVTIDPTVVSSIQEFVSLVITDARLEQGAQEACNGEYDNCHIGAFIGWVCKDVTKECQAELEVSCLDWKQVSKFITTAARQWYLLKVKS